MGFVKKGEGGICKEMGIFASSKHVIELNLDGMMNSL